MVFEEAVNPKANSNNKAGGTLEDDLEKNPLFSKVQPDGRIKCKAPECKMMVSAQNIARHWNQYHPTLKKNDYQPSLRHLLRMLQAQKQEEEQTKNGNPTKSPSAVNPVTPVEKTKGLRCGNAGCK